MEVAIEEQEVGSCSQILEQKGYARIPNAHCPENPEDILVLVEHEKTCIELGMEEKQEVSNGAKDSQQSFCRFLIRGLFNRSESQYKEIKKEFAKNNGQYGIYVQQGKEMQDEGNEEFEDREVQDKYAIYFKLPPKEPWHQDARVRTAAAVGFGVTGLLGMGGYLAGKSAGRDEEGAFYDFI